MMLTTAEQAFICGMSYIGTVAAFYFCKVYFVFLYVCCLHEYLCSGCAQCLGAPVEGVRTSETGVADGCGCRDSNLAILEEQQVLLSIEPALQLLYYIFAVYVYLCLGHNYCDKTP